jgi:predicted DNA-binding antitoxin AbrB/MazE fold protein
MTWAIEAIFENGVLRPLNPLQLTNQQKVHLIVDTVAPAAASTGPWHWQEARAITDGVEGSVAEEVNHQRREG